MQPPREAAGSASKYNPDGSRGSTWHAMFNPGLHASQMQTQGDETALVIWALAEHAHYCPEECVGRLYASWARSVADWLATYRRSDNLPKPSFDVWEESCGVWTFTAATVVAGLGAAAMAQAYGTEEIERDLWLPTSIGGIARYPGDRYYQRDASLPGNPWIIATIWLAQRYIARDDPQRGLELLSGVASLALPSGILAEQVDPHTGEPVSVSPLTWSHSAYTLAIQQYLRAGRTMEQT